MGTTVALQAGPENHPKYPTWKYVVPLPSPELMANVGSPDIESYFMVGDAWAQVIAKFLRSDDTVLDIGSGCGRIARFLINLPDIRYIGFDIFKANVEWCSANLTPLSSGRFRFHHFDGQSDFYNPGGTIAASDYRFPADRASVDLVFAASIFTHLKERDAVHYLRESHRVLKPGGLALFSILPNPQHGPYSGDESRVEIDPSYFVRLADRAGLVLKERIGNVIGLELLLFENADYSSDEQVPIVTRVLNRTVRFLPSKSLAVVNRFSPSIDRFAGASPPSEAIHTATPSPHLSSRVAAHEQLLLDLQARVTRLENLPQAPPRPTESLATVLQTAYGPLPLPPAPLRQRVHGAGDTESFLHVGQQCAHDIEAALTSIGRDATSFHSVLDFGCGCGRTLMHLAPRWQHATFRGTDIDTEAIAWCRQNLSFAAFTTNDAHPPLPFDSDTFDLVYAISVFTHLPEDFQFQWLEELQRVTALGGIVLVTLHGAFYTEQPAALPPETLAELSDKGFAFFKSLGKESPFPDWYQATYHTQAYVLAEFSRYFTVRAYIPKALNGHQDIVLLAKP